MHWSANLLLRMRRTALVERKFAVRVILLTLLRTARCAHGGLYLQLSYLWYVVWSLLVAACVLSGWLDFGARGPKVRWCVWLGLAGWLRSEPTPLVWWRCVGARWVLPCRRCKFGRFLWFGCQACTCTFDHDLGVVLAGGVYLFRSTGGNTETTCVDVAQSWLESR